VLLRDALWCFAGFGGNGALKSTVAGEGPAGTAAALILDRIHVAKQVVINVGGSLLETTSTATIAIAAIAIAITIAIAIAIAALSVAW